ncbi:helix-turn-helix domain-containing protein [Rhodococcus hoagii]|jgi:DNA-binding IclR family transcriptional regulator|uniref:IclR helix-turn-helix domain protein n=4 Tax=Rhodococcus hoagii TaxID=43767 RepID=E9SWH1_RHOHA|nr:helix-turn-helix domain-containing protein [Prescottella equi]EGD25917.1 IclR helix-turn-helix domain protein [Prescottella equi ATCC 33707]ERN43343.1 IclR family transcriptional regulator [Prescottella equi NBRC 101255 = C 7]MBU4614319.1 helix-turn-helix domain-containing protein [Rhodococcus sp. GG48]CBH50402.1 putative IclR family transcriptional regulator [Prescottella equi 103S]GBF15532.1 HTH-type transcriptional regulator KipR [Rhodococcus sp. Br-6]
MASVGSDERMNESAGRTGAVQLDSRMSKTLHNGLEILELLTQHKYGLTITEIGEGIGVHRTVADRLVRTLEAHRLCRRTESKRILLGSGLVTLAGSVEQDLRELARPILEELADSVEATAHLAVREGEDSVRALMVIEPRNSRAHVGFNAGQIDPINRGSAGLAMLAALPPQEGERPEVTRARERGFAVTSGEVTHSVTGISATLPNRRPADLVSIGVSVFDSSEEQKLGEAVMAAARRLGALLLR